jgi:hypothetical protein
VAEFCNTLQKGMKKEAALFASVVEELKTTEQEIKDLLSQQSS